MDTRLFINTNGNYAEVDLYDDIDIPVTYNVGDVRDITKKDSNWSLTIRMPNTQNNAQLFELTNDISRYNSTFEMLKQYPAFVEVGCNRTFEGYFRLTKVIINDNEDVSYEGNLYSNVIEFMSRLGTTTLRGNADRGDDLSFSEHTTFLDENEMQDRLINMRPNFSFILTNKGNYDGFYTPVKSECALQNVGGNEVVPFYYDELTPYLYVKDILDKIGEWSKFNIISDFFDASPSFLSEIDVMGFDFSKLIYPYVGENSQYNAGVITDVARINQNTNNAFSAINIVGANFSPNPTYTQVDDGANFTYPDYTNNNSTSATYYVTPHRFHINREGFFHISANLKAQLGVDFLYDPGVTPPLVPAGQTITVLNTSPMVSMILEVGVYHSVSTATSTASSSVSEQLRSQYYTHNPDSTHFSTVTMLEGELVQDFDMYLEAGDEVYLRLGISVPAATTNPNAYIYRYTSGGQDHNVLPKNMNLWIVPQTIGNEVLRIEKTSTISINNDFDPTFILSPAEKKTDFILNLIRKFNLYVEDVTNKKDSNGVYYRNYPNIRQDEPILKFEPRNYYYRSNNTIRDFSNKTDVSSIEFERIDEYLYKQLFFRDKFDDEYFVKTYNDNKYYTGEFGEQKVIGTFNTSNDDKLELTTNLGETMVIPIPNENSTIEVPSLLSFDNNGVIRNKQYNSRILFCKSINIASYGFSKIQWVGLYNRHFRLNSYPYNSPYDFGVETPDVMFSSYNYAGHFNSPFGTDTADLNFGWANWYYQNLNGTWATAKNTYNVFYKQMIEDYNSPEARLMKCKMYLKSSDIRDLQLSDTILVNNVSYHINKIKQWKNEYEPVEVELIKIIQSTSKSNQPILKNKPPKMEIVTLNTLKELIESQNKAINQISKQVETMNVEIKKMDEQLIKLDERVKKLEGGGSETSEDGSNPDKDENNKDDYD